MKSRNANMLVGMFLHYVWCVLVCVSVCLGIYFYIFKVCFYTLMPSGVGVD